MQSEQNLTIAIIDSGIGGVSILNQLICKFKAGNFIYLADNLHMPYGNKNSRWLKKRIDNLIYTLNTKYKTDKIIIACNTASTCTNFNEYSNVIPMKFYKNVTYYATPLTKNNLNDISVVSDKNLATQIEKYILDNERLYKIVLKHIKQHNLTHLKKFVLGCTHYELVKPIFEKICVNSKIINNSSFIINNISLKPNDELNLIVLTTKKNKSLEEKIRYLAFKHLN